MWFDILRKGNTEAVYDRLIEDIKSLKKIVNDPPKLLEPHLKEFAKILKEYEDELDLHIYKQNDDWGDYNLDKKYYLDFAKKIDNYQQQLSDAYNKIPKKLKTQKYSISPKTSDAIKLINRKLNKMGSLLMTSDFEFAGKDSSYGRYSREKDRGMANLSNREPEHRTIDEIVETLMHEDGHRASALIARELGVYPYDDEDAWKKPERGYGLISKPFFEEMLAYLIEYPFDKEYALWRWLNHPSVIKDKDKDDKLREVYDKIKERFRR